MATPSRTLVVRKKKEMRTCSDWLQNFSHLPSKSSTRIERSVISARISTNRRT